MRAAGAPGSRAGDRMKPRTSSTVARAAAPPTATTLTADLTTRPAAAFGDRIPRRDCPEKGRVKSIFGHLKTGGQPSWGMAARTETASAPTAAGKAGGTKAAPPPA